MNGIAHAGMGKPISRMTLPTENGEFARLRALTKTPLITKAIKTPVNILVLPLQYKRTHEMIVESHIIELRMEIKMR